MTKQALTAAMLMTALVGFTLLASSPFSDSWSSEITFEQAAVNPFKTLNSILDLNYSFGSFLRAKAAMMTAVARHIDCVPESKAYYDRKRAEGKKHNQAVRALGRHLVRVIWSMLKNERDYELREVIPSVT